MAACACICLHVLAYACMCYYMLACLTVTVHVRSSHMCAATREGAEAATVIGYSSRLLLAHPVVVTAYEPFAAEYILPDMAY